MRVIRKVPLYLFVPWRGRHPVFYYVWITGELVSRESVLEFLANCERNEFRTKPLTYSKVGVRGETAERKMRITIAMVNMTRTRIYVSIAISPYPHRTRKDEKTQEYDCLVRPLKFLISYFDHAVRIILRRNIPILR